MKYSLHYVLALSLIAAPLAANDCTENACAVEVAQPEQQGAQPFYKKALQKLWEHKYKIAAVSAAAIAAALLYRYSNAVFGLKTTEVKPVGDVTVTGTSASASDANKQNTLAPENNPLDSTAKTKKSLSELTWSEVPAKIKEAFSTMWSKIPSFSWHGASKKGPHHLDGVDAVMP